MNIRDRRANVTANCGRLPQRGVSLIEVLVSLVIFSLGLLGLIGLQARATNYSTDVENAQIASVLANNLASQLWAVNSVDSTKTAVAAAVTSCDNQAVLLKLPSGNCTLTNNTAKTVATIVINWLTPYKQTTDPSKPNYAPPTGDQYVTQVQLP